MDDADGLMPRFDGAIEKAFDAPDRLACAQADDAELASIRLVAEDVRHRRDRRGPGGGAAFAQLGGRDLKAHRAALDPRSRAVDVEQLAADATIADLDDVAALEPGGI